MFSFETGDGNCGEMSSSDRRTGETGRPTPRVRGKASPLQREG